MMMIIYIVINIMVKFKNFFFFDFYFGFLNIEKFKKGFLNIYDKKI